MRSGSEFTAFLIVLIFLENGTNTKACIPGMEGTPDLTLVGG